MGSLAGKVAVVTGGGKGIGRACVERLAREGANVVCADINEDSGRETVEAVSMSGGQATFIACDVGEKLDVRNLVAGAVDAYGRIDALVNNAGIILTGEFLDLSLEDFDKVLRVNLRGAFMVAQAVARRMVEQVKEGGSPGAIVNMSSVNAVFAIPNQVPYSISKGGMNQLTKVMALSLAPHGIRVNAIGPGSIQTDMLGTVMHNADMRRRILSRTPLGRAGDPSEVASIAAFLLGDDASYITGQVIYCDGGRMPLNYTVPVKE